MSDGLTTETLRAGLTKIAAGMEAAAAELSALDGQVGDGDLGVTMQRGCREMMNELPGLPADLGLALMKCAQAFTRISGSTYGTLLATGLMSAAKAVKGRTDLPWIELPALLGGALEAMMQRGRGTLGDKTVLDVLAAVRDATAGVSDPAAMLAAAASAAQAALDEFRGRLARQGRARIFGDKTIGLDDPGMVAFKRIIDSLK
ncbi:MAG: dihydroxyacetone kinase subunit L [Dongiaceae bacterium]